MIDGLFNSGSMPVLEKLVNFTSARHKAIVNNIANLSTPNYQPTDLSVSDFQKSLQQAIEKRRDSAGGDSGPIELSDLKPTKLHDNILFHDGNNRSLEGQMQALAENTMTHNEALEMLRNQFSMLQTAIRGTV